MATAIGTRTVTVNAAFLYEIKEVNEELRAAVQRLQQLCQRPVLLSAHARQLVEQSANLRDQLAMHFALEEVYGYFDDPETVDPRFSERVDHLRF